jgi:hypothetical protein
VKTPKIIITDADGLAEFDAPAFVIFNISKREIETLNTASAIERLHVMTDSKHNVLRFRESIAFQVDGYDTDRRELPEIPEVRKYFAALCQEWPHWFWFLSRGTGAISLLLSLLCPVKLHRSPDGTGYGIEFIDDQQLMRVIKDLFGRGNVMFDAFEIDEKLLIASAQSAMRELEP